MPDNSEFLPRFRLTESYVRPHALKRSLNMDTNNTLLLEQAARVLDGYEQPTVEERTHLVQKLEKAAEDMLAEGWYMTELTMLSAAHYISLGTPSETPQQPKPPAPESDSQP